MKTRMLRTLRGQAIGIMALIVALGGTSYAALKLPKNSVGTKQIKKGAVTAPKIKAGAVGSGAIATGAVSNAKLASGAVGTTQLNDNAVTGAKITDGTITGAKITDGTITAGKLAGGVIPTYTAGTGLALAGTEFSASGSQYQQVVAVAKAGGDFTSVQAALDSIVDADTSKRYLVWVAPGSYDGVVTMKPYVDIAGAGPGATTITSSASGPGTATVIAAPNCELRDIKVANTHLAGVGLYGSFVTDFALRHTLVTSDGLGSGIGVKLESSTVEANDVQVHVQGTPGAGSIYGLIVDGGTFRGTNVRLDIKDGGSVVGAYVMTGASVTLVGSTILGTLTGTGTVIGIITDTSAWSLVLHSNTISIDGDTGSANGLDIYGPAPTTKAMLYATSVTAVGTGGAYGISAHSMPLIDLLASNVQGGTQAIHSTTATTHAQASQLTGGIGGGGTFRLSGTMLEGGASGGTFTCFASYDEAFLGLDATCA